jgi:hypothetical protein
MSIMILLLVAFTIISSTDATPKERVMVKYKVKDGGKGERVKMLDIIENEKVKHMNAQEALNMVETAPTITERSKSIPSSIPDYKDTATIIMGQLQRAARNGDL